MMDYNLEKIVNHRISTIAVLMKRQVFKLIAENGLKITPDQWVVMYYLWQENGISVGEIARRSKKDFANVTRIVEKLEKQGYVSKTKSKKDSRISNVFILPKADEIREDIQDVWKQASDIALNEVSEKEQEQLMEILAKIEKNVSKSLE